MSSKIFSFSFYILFSLAFASCELQASSKETPNLEAQLHPKASALTVQVHNVGQGNFVSLEFWNEKEKKVEYIVVDCGSSSHQHELEHINKKLKDIHSQDFPLPGKLDKLLEGKRRSLGTKENESPLHIKALILTHPDEDHCNGLADLFPLAGPQDKIDYIICGGLPKSYHNKEHNNLETWLKEFLTRGSKVYFPALSYEPIKDLKEIEPVNPKSYKPYEAWGEPKHTSEDYTSHPFPELVKELSEINRDFKLYFLEVNPLHRVGPGGVVRLSNASAEDKYADESNQESLCLKIEYGSTSAILTGDATGMTTSSIQVNYTPPFLKTNTLLGSHHGSFTEGSNNDVWLALTQPEYVFFSNGQHHKYGHPHKETIGAVRVLESLKRDVKQHHISWTSHKRESRQGEATQDALFLTYESGDLTAELYKAGHVKVKTQVDGNVIEETKAEEESKEETKESMELDQQQQALSSTPLETPKETPVSGVKTSREEDKEKVTIDLSKKQKTETKEPQEEKKQEEEK